MSSIVVPAKPLRMNASAAASRTFARTSAATSGVALNRHLLIRRQPSAP
jgi:hypothetical protein